MAHAPSHNSGSGAAAQFDEMDPHGFAQGHGHHGHVIVGPLQLRSVLAILLFFTALTVGLAQAEIWIASFFEITLPWWVNITVAMSIATIKSLMVMAIFMQLRYDNPMNSIVMAFTFIALFLFLFFTGLDLFTRNRVYEWKAGQVVVGGTGAGVKTAGGMPMVQAARERWIAAHGQEAWDKKNAELSHGHAHAHDEHEAGNTANRSRPATGLSGALSSEGPHGEIKHDAHGQDHKTDSKATAPAKPDSTKH